MWLSPFLLSESPKYIFVEILFFPTLPITAIIFLFPGIQSNSKILRTHSRPEREMKRTWTIGHATLDSVMMWYLWWGMLFNVLGKATWDQGIIGIQQLIWKNQKISKTFLFSNREYLWAPFWLHSHSQSEHHHKLEVTLA